MKKLTMIFMLMSCLSIETYGQFGKFLKEKVKEVAKEVIDPEEQTRKLREQQLQKDTTFYNYALAQNDKATFFNSKDDNQSLILGALKFQDDSEDLESLELSTYEQAFDYNRKGATLLFVNDLLAASNFWSAIGIYLDEEEESEALSTMIVSRMMNSDPSERSNYLLSMMNEMAQQNLELPDYYAIAKSVSNLGILYHANGQYSLARELSEANQLFIAAKIGTGSLAMAAEYNNYAVILRDLGEYTASEKTFDKGREILSTRGEEESIAFALLLNNQSMLFASLGRYTEAERLLNLCIRLAEDKLNTKGSDFSKFKINLALIKQEQQAYGEAEGIYKEVLRLKEKRFGKRHEDYAAVQNNLAALYMETGSNSEVEPLLINALDIYGAKLGESHPAYASTLVNLGKYHYVSSNYDEAKKHLSRASQIYEDNFGDYNPKYIEVLGQLAKVTWRQKKYEEADQYFDQQINKNIQLLENNFPAMSEQEKSKYWQKLRPSLLTYFNYAVYQQEINNVHIRKMYELQLKTKGILLNSTTKVKNEILSGNDKALKQLYRQWINTREQLANYYTYSKEQLAEEEVDLTNLENQANDLEKQLSERSTAFADATGLPKASIDDILGKLSSNEAAIEVIRLQATDSKMHDQAAYAFLIIKAGKEVPEVVLLKAGNDLETKFANAYRRQIEFKTEDDFSFEKFWAPVEDKLSGINKIYFSPDGIYNQINILTLQEPGGEYLLDKYQLVTLASTRFIDKANQSMSDGKVVMVGAPEYGNPQKLAPLPGTKKEIETISSMLKQKSRAVETFLDREAKEDIFKSKINSPSVLHIATHGFFMTDVSGQTGGNVFGISLEKAAENPLLRAGLMFTDATKVMDEVTSKEVKDNNDGILTAYEAMLMDLSNTDMVILSACETGLGEVKAGEGVYGLQRAFQVAGANNIIMSLWKVNDEATQQMMTNFYREWLSTGDRNKAFRAAQQAVKSKFDAPYYWGAFVMMN